MQPSRRHWPLPMRPPRWWMRYLSGHAELADAQTVQTNALAVHTQLVAIQGALVEGQSAGPHLGAISTAATLADDNVAPAESLTADLTALVDPGGSPRLWQLLTAANAALATAVANRGDCRQLPA